MQATAEASNPLDDSPNAAVVPDADRVIESTDVIEVVEIADMGSLEWLLVGVSLSVLLAFGSSLVRWVVLLKKGKRPFGPNALVPLSSRPRPYWNAIHFVIFYGFVIVFSVLMSVGAGALGYLDLDALRAASNETEVEDGSEAVASSSFKTIELGGGESNSSETEVAVNQTNESSDQSPVEAVTAEPSVIGVPQLLISSFAMLLATLASMGLLTLMRPRLPNVSASSVDGSEPPIGLAMPGFGWMPNWRLVGLGLVAAWLILPPTMLMMGAVSALQEYSHPVLDALKPSDADAGPDFAVFAALFFTTAIVTPVVEEFWFRGLLQGGLQRLADARTDAVKWGMTGTRASEETLPALNETGDPFQPPQFEPTLSNDGPGTRVDLASLPDPSTRTDWVPTAIWPLLVASLLFAVMHWGQGLAPIPLFFLSLGLGYLYRQTGSLIPSIVVHFVLNGFTMSATFLELLR